MKPYFEDESVQIYHGDAREVLPEIARTPDVVITDPPYSSTRAESEFAATGNIAVILHMASLLVPTMAVFGTSSGRGIEFIRSSVRSLRSACGSAWSCSVLVLMRRIGEELVISHPDGDIRVVVLGCQGNTRAKIGIAAPASVTVARSEVHRTGAVAQAFERAQHRTTIRDGRPHAGGEA